MYTTKQLPSAAMETLKQFSDKHVSMETHGQQYSTAINNINFELGHTTLSPLISYDPWLHSICSTSHWVLFAGQQ
jgi:hypothetical protein